MAIVKLQTIIITLILSGLSISQEPFRVGTTAASFLELGYDARGLAMGNAQAGNSFGLNSVLWNPSGVSEILKPEITVMIQPWILDINNNMIGAAFPAFNSGVIALSYYGISYGREKMTTLENQEGTGESFDGHDMSLALTAAAKITDKFSIGISVKYISSRIWKVNSSALCLDLGSTIKTDYLNTSNRKGGGVNIGMSISNYGTRMRYDGIGLNYTTDISEDDGNYEYTPVRFDTDTWELPLFFRLGISWQPLNKNRQSLLLALDAVHPNNNSEYLNLGSEYLIRRSKGEIAIRAGYRGLYMDKSEFGLTFGAGIKLNLRRNRFSKIDVSFRNAGVFGWLQAYTIGISL